VNLSEVILGCLKYEDSDESMRQVFAKKINGRFEPNSQAVILELTLEEMEMDLVKISGSKCPGYDYFLELYILQDFYRNIKDLKEFITDQDIVKRIIYYAEFDA
jgi:hypothetical protein